MALETCRRLKADEATQDLPVIFMTALADTGDKVKGFQAGGVDYVTKPIQQEEVLARITTHLKIRNLTFRLQERNEELQELSEELHEMNNKLLQVTDELRDANLALSKRAVQLEASHQVGQQITSFLDLNALLPEVVKLIRAKFGYYFVGVWLFNEQQQKVILQASAGRDEAQLLKSGFSIPMAGQPQNLIASVCQTGKAYLADDVSQDAQYQVLEELPETRSMLALPLQMGERVLGVLDIQSNHLTAFDAEDQTALQALANQIAIAIRNARLYGLEKMMRNMEQEKAQALAKLNADKDKFFSIISHDLRSPFNSLLNNAEFMVEMVAELDRKDIREIAGSISHGVKTAYNLLENLLSWSQMQRQGGMKVQPRPIELHPLAQETVEILRQTATQKNILLENTIPADLYVYADRHMINTVIRNLTNNALKFTPKGGAITLSARPERTQENGEGSPPFVIVSVSDTGVGIKPEDMAKLFRIDVHHSTAGTHKEEGTGLGLIICKEMVERNGGQISIKSVSGQGTTVEFTVPQRNTR